MTSEAQYQSAGSESAAVDQKSFDYDQTPETSCSTLRLAEQIKDAGQDFEWYPTTKRMVQAILSDLDDDRIGSILDVGAGDGRVLIQMAEKHDTAKLYSIEKSPILQQAQPDRIIPVGTDFYEQNLMTVKVDVIVSNPPYSQFEEWSERLISTGHARMLYLIIPERWEQSELLKAALKAREAETKVIHRGDFLDAERRARAVVHIVRVAFAKGSRWGYERTPDPFDAWFDANIDTFDREREPEDPDGDKALARIRELDNIPDMVDAFNEDYARMEDNYRAIFKLDAALLKELGVDKASVREGLKKRMQGLKHQYWEALFLKLDVITSRLTTKTKKSFLERLTGQTSVAFTVSNCYAVVLWAIKAANLYLDTQVVELFRELSTHDGVLNYKSNQKTWREDGWRYMRYGRDGLGGENVPRDYALDYRIVLHHYSAIFKADFGRYDYPGNLHNSSHEQIADVVAVMGNLGFRVVSPSSLSRQWISNEWQDFRDHDGAVVFQVKAFMNGNLHWRFMPAAIRALNVEAGRLLGWLRSPKDVVDELGYSAEEATKFFGANRQIGAGSVRLLPAAQ